jgi:hypothetical protein
MFTRTGYEIKNPLTLILSNLFVLESSDEELIETTSIKIKPSSTTTFPMTTAFRVRCLLNRQCASMDKNSHCTLFGRCICNRGYKLETSNRGQHCIQQIIHEDDCNYINKNIEKTSSS